MLTFRRSLSLATNRRAKAAFLVVSFGGPFLETVDSVHDLQRRLCSGEATFQGSVSLSWLTRTHPLSTRRRSITGDQSKILRRLMTISSGASWKRYVREPRHICAQTDTQQVYETIGVSGPGEEASSKPTFSRDVLQLEISGPDQEHLSVIDVPGIFRNPKENVTTKDDIALVRSIVNDYMVNRRSVMLVVISANIDLANQEILELAKAIDPEGDRTLGVLTKPDLVDKGTEPGIIALVEGRADKLKLGWHLVRNPGQAEVNDITFDRLHQEEVFFSTQAPWNKLDPSKVGIDLLRLRLREVLTKLVRKEFSKVGKARFPAVIN